MVDRLIEVNAIDIHTEKSWKKYTQIVLDCQKQWSSIGFTSKSDNQKIWDKFKSQADEFFDKKNAFYLVVKTTYDENRNKKEELIQKAEACVILDHGPTIARELADLQKQWRKIGAAHHRDEQRLWKRFRTICNSFFETKKMLQNRRYKHKRQI